MDARAAPIAAARHKPGAWLEGRATLTVVPKQFAGSSSSSSSIGPPQQRLVRGAGVDDVAEPMAAAAARIRSAPKDFGFDEDPQTNVYDDDADADEHIDRDTDKTHALRRRIGARLRRLALGLGAAGESVSAIGANAQLTLPGGRRRKRSRQQPAAVQNDNEQVRAVRAILRIEDLSSEDNGLYRCRVDFRRARSRIKESELRIIGKY